MHSQTLLLLLLCTVVLARSPSDFLRPGCSEPGEKCRPPSQCALFYSDPIPPKTCLLSASETSGPGICCPDVKYNHVSVQSDLRSELATKNNYEPVYEVKSLSSADLDASTDDAFAFVENLEKLEETIRNAGIKVDPKSPQAGHHMVTMASDEARIVSLRALQIATATKSLKRRLGLDDPEKALRQVDMKRTNLGERCPASPACTMQLSKYRTFDGSCNNPNHPWMGRALTRVQRLLPAHYQDGVMEPRLAKNGLELPKPRILSFAFSPSVEHDPEDSKTTVLVSDFGQFLAHDFILTPTFTLSDGSAIECCKKDGSGPLPKYLRHPQCMPMDIPEGDELFEEHKVKCMSFVRSMLAPLHNCSLGAAKQLNANSHWFDGSTIYGSNDERANKLRGPSGTLLTQGQGAGALPPTTEENICLKRANFINENFCFFSGDFRANEQPAQAAIHTLFIREHNRIANILAVLNPAWSSSEIYEETRRIVVAEMQHITFNEFLPVLLGRKFMETFGMLPLSEGFSEDYNPEYDGSVTNEFGAAAFRLHTFIRGTFKLTDANGNIEEIKLRELFLSPQTLPWPAVGDSVLRGQTNTSLGDFDFIFHDEVTNYMYKGDSESGFDIVSLNIQRGRDHGLPSYNDYRELCGLPRARGFLDLDNLRPEALKVIKEFYTHVDDIDLFVGGQAERKVEGTLLGNTFLCIVGDQFVRFKKADRFFYDLKNQPSSFLANQLTQIRKTSLARIICDNAVDISKIQPLVFMAITDSNPVVSCTSSLIPRMDLGAWSQTF